MMAVKVRKLEDGLHPQEVVVGLNTLQGILERLIIHRRTLREDDSIAIGYPISSDNNSYLIELPHETERGSWRVWVPKGDVYSAA